MSKNILKIIPKQFQEKMSTEFPKELTNTFSEIEIAVEMLKEY